MISLTHLIPCYNTQAHHLLECVKSIRSQEANPILIVDDGSTEDETKLALALLEQTVDSLQVYRTGKNLGTPSALNIGHSLIDSDYTALMGSSDIALPGKYAHQIELLLKFPKIDVLGTGLMAFKDADPFRRKFFTLTHKEQPKPGDHKEHHKHFITNHGTVIYKNAAVKAVGGYNVNYRRGQDVELWSRMWANKACFRNIDKVYYLFRR